MPRSHPSGRPTISVLCPTAHAGPIVAEALGSLRAAVDEIIVAADSRVGASDLGHYAQVADVLLRYEHCGANRHWPWLAEQARGDWLLLLDGDELASAALTAALPDLVADRRIRQYSLPIHWVWPDPGSRLIGEPWGTDRRLRLVRNDGRLAFGARKHMLVEPDGPFRSFDELPTYHIDLLLPDRARREAKVARYDAELFGLLTPQGEPFNEAFYFPEASLRDHETLPLPTDDAGLVRRVLGARHDPAHERDPACVALHSQADVAWRAPRAQLPADAYRATLAPARELPSFTAGREDHLVWLRVTNDGTARWPGGEHRHPLVRVGVTWQPEDGPPVDRARTALPHALDPGESTLVAVQVPAPQQSGSAELVLDLVHEHVRWFGCPFSARLNVGASATERLAALTARHGPVVPADAVMRARRTIDGRDGLLRPSPPGSCSAGWANAELTRDMPVGGWALDEVTIDRLAELVRRERPRVVVEFGSGTSTIVLAALLCAEHEDEDGPSVISFEEDPWWAGRTGEELKMRGLDHVATVMHLPLGQADGDAPGCYLLTDEAAEILRASPPELVLVDGPTLGSGASRLGTPDLVAGFLRRDAVLLLDDALRDAELCVAAAWQRRNDIVVHGIRPTPKGLLEATLRAPTRRGRLSRTRGRRR